MNKFKAGDKVYYPLRSTKVLTVYEQDVPDEYSLKIYLDDGTAETFTEDGKKYSTDKAVPIFHATPETQRLLEHLHGIKLEDASVKPTSKEIVKAYLDRGDKSVCCWASNINEQPGSINKWVFIEQVIDGNYPFVDKDGFHWRHATPFDHTTLQPITELPKGDAKAV